MKQIVIVTLAAALTGCGCHGYTPAVDLGAGEYHPDQGIKLAKDTLECKALVSDEGNKKFLGLTINEGCGEAFRACLRGRGYSVVK